jgi:hypothetical protein
MPWTSTTFYLLLEVSATFGHVGENARFMSIRQAELWAIGCRFAPSGPDVHALGGQEVSIRSTEACAVAGASDPGGNARRRCLQPSDRRVKQRGFMCDRLVLLMLVILLHLIGGRRTWPRGFGTAPALRGHNDC